MQFEATLQSRCRVGIVFFIEVEHAEVVICGGEMRSKLNHCLVFLDRRGIVVTLLSGLGLGIKLLYLGSYFIIRRLRKDR